MTGRNGERERSLYNFLVELSEELNEAKGEAELYATCAMETLAKVCEDLQRSLNIVLQTASVPPGSWQQEVYQNSAWGDLDRGVTLKHCLKKLEEFLEDNPDLEICFETRIRNKLREIKSPAPFDAGYSPEAI